MVLLPLFAFAGLCALFLLLSGLFLDFLCFVRLVDCFFLGAGTWVICGLFCSSGDFLGFRLFASLWLGCAWLAWAVCYVFFAFCCLDVWVSIRVVFPHTISCLVCWIVRFVCLSEFGVVEFLSCRFVGLCGGMAFVLFCVFLWLVLLVGGSLLGFGGLR